MDMDKDIHEKASLLLTKQKASGNMRRVAQNAFDFKEVEELVLELRNYGLKFGSIFEVLRDQNGLTMTRSTFHRYYKALMDKTNPKPSEEDTNREPEQPKHKKTKKQKKRTKESVCKKKLN